MEQVGVPAKKFFDFHPGKQNRGCLTNAVRQPLFFCKTSGIVIHIVDDVSADSRERNWMCFWRRRKRII